MYQVYLYTWMSCIYIEIYVMNCAKGIKLDGDVYDDLAKMGDKTETFSDVVKRLIEHYKKTKK